MFLLPLAVCAVACWQRVEARRQSAAAVIYGAKAWGRGSFGQIGNGTFYTTGNQGVATPVAVSTSSDVVAVSAGDNHSLALKSDGTVVAWGYGYSGQLGDGTFYTSGNFGSAIPVQVKGVGGAGTLSGIVAISAGGEHNLALKSDGTVVAWGSGSSGQLGDGNFYPSSPNGVATPVQVKGVGGAGVLSGVVAIDGGIDHSLALKSDGTVVAWGSGMYGELGDGTFHTTGNFGSATPVQVKGVGGAGTLSGVVAIAGAGSFSLALKSDGTVVAWGYGGNGQLGDGTFYTSGNQGVATPVQVKGVGGTGTLSGVVAVAGESVHSLALKSDGTVLAWGRGYDGELGDGTFYTTGNQGVASPVQVKAVGGSGSLSGVVAIAGGEIFSLALKADGTVVAWGYGFYGQLGDGTFYTSGNQGVATPVAVSGLTGQSGISAGRNHSLSTQPQLNATAGANVFLQAGEATVTFANLSNGGTLTLNRVDSTAQGALSGYTFNSTYPAFDINTTATPVASSNIRVCLKAPDVIDQPTFVQLRLLHSEGGTLVDRTSASNFTTRQVCGDVTSLSPFVVAFNPNAPTAAATSIGGQITTSNGAPLSGATVTLSGAKTARAITDGQGSYRFTNLEANGFYIVASSRANFTFSPASRSFALTANVSDAAFTATEDSAETKNPLDTSEYFVRQQYLDFLDREPDEGGLSYWSSQFDGCAGDASCLRLTRINVSAAFFIEAEFQQTGSFIYRLYRAAYGARPGYSQFSGDRSRVKAGVSLEASKAAFADEFVSRAQFKQAYPEQMSNEEFVNKLYDTAGLSGSADERQSYTSWLNAGGTRSQVLRGIIDSDVFKMKEYNSAFVLMQYYGYLRRDVDEEGYRFWLNVLNTREPNNYRGMVCSFITSAEYQNRFSSVLAHSNSECGQ